MFDTYTMRPGGLPNGEAEEESTENEKEVTCVKKSERARAQIAERCATSASVVGS